MDLKMMGVLAALMRDRDRLKDAAERVQDRLRDLRVEGQAGGGAVRATASGQMKILDIQFADAVIGSAAPAAREQAQRLAAEAVNDALAKAQEAARAAVAQELEQLGLGSLVGESGQLGALCGLLP
jgi:nucleoid-associated protein EbfC